MIFTSVKATFCSVVKFQGASNFRTVLTPGVRRGTSRATRLGRCPRPHLCIAILPRRVYSLCFHRLHGDSRSPLSVKSKLLRRGARILCAGPFISSIASRHTSLTCRRPSSPARLCARESASLSPVARGAPKFENNILDTPDSVLLSTLRVTSIFCDSPRVSRMTQARPSQLSVHKCRQFGGTVAMVILASRPSRADVLSPT